jgi:hypothetical protein
LLVNTAASVAEVPSAITAHMVATMALFDPDLAIRTLLELTASDKP